MQLPSDEHGEARSGDSTSGVQTVGGKPALPGMTAAASASAATKRRYPVRFVWQMDAEERFTIGSDEFIALAGPRTAAVLGCAWNEVAARLEIDPEGRVARAVGSHDTWSGIAVAWPVDGVSEPLNVELSGLPVFDRERAFRGYRGFGVCRELDRLAAAGTGQRLASEPIRASNAQASGTEEVDATAGDSEVAAAGDTGARQQTGLQTPPPSAPEPARVPSDGRPVLTIVPPVKNVVPFRAAAAPRDDKRAALTAVEHTAFQEIARVLGARMEVGHWLPPVTEVEQNAAAAQSNIPGPETAPSAAPDVGEPEGPLSLDAPAESVDVLNEQLTADRLKTSESALRASEAENHELNSILDTATDGILVVDGQGRIRSSNRGVAALFGYEPHELAARHFTDLLAPESHRVALDYLHGLTQTPVPGLLKDGHEVIGRMRQGGLIPLFMTMGPVSHDEQRVCAVFRDITQWKRAEEELIAAKRQAERASSAKSDFLAKISHEIRTPLNAVIGFSEVMMEERFGPIANERYRQYLRDIHASGQHLVSLINDLLDLSKIEAGKLDLAFASVDINELTQQCVALMQPQANRERIIIRASLSPRLPPVVADARSIRQIVLNLLSNSIKFTGAGGQVIVSTAVTDAGAAVLRVRDTGIGMNDREVEAALEPFRQLSTSRPQNAGGTGLGLPLTKALAEANRASFHIKSAVNSGTLVEVVFPVTRVLAE